MLLLGVADCCRIIHFFAFTASSVLLISITFCFDLPAFASFKRQTNGKLSSRTRICSRMYSGERCAYRNVLLMDLWAKASLASRMYPVFMTIKEAHE